MRKKRTPIRRHCRRDENDGEEVQSEILGRVQLKNSYSLDYMMANEIARDLEDAEENRKKNAINSNSFGINEIEQNIESSRHHQQLQLLPPTLASIEREIAERERSTFTTQRKKTKKTRKVKQTSSKKVHFATTLLAEIPPPELIIERCVDHSDTKGDCVYQRLLHVCPRKYCDDIDYLISSHKTTSSNRAVLSSFNLSKTKIMMSAVTSKRNSAQHLIITGIAIRELWKEYKLPHKSQFLSSLIECSQKDWIQLILFSPNEEDLPPSLNIVLTQLAFESCHNLPLTQQHRQRKKYATANCLQNVIQTLFGILKGAPICSEDKSTDEISAKRVYNLVDNKQIERYTNDDDDEDDKKVFPILHIEGLRPTLRPYQAAAVKWMIEREHLTTHGEEWKVIWMALDSMVRCTTPLVQLKEGQNNGIIGPFYCPFNGRIARTIDEAKEMTLMGRTRAIRGGILAEQMGLGKTVEVLALVLSNPRPQILETSIGRPACQRQLIFEDDSEANSEQNEALSEFEGTDDFLGANVHTVEQTRNLARTVPATVTPNTVITQRWIDTLEVGSCICGDLICFSGKPQKMKIVFCESCEEPMHLTCTCLRPVAIEKMPRLVLRRTFGNEKLECVVCKECPCCLAGAKTQPIISRATVIICPPSICHQWEQEIKRHTKQKRVITYSGIEKEIKRSRIHPHAMRLLHPAYMADADIILISFNALMSDLSHSEENRYAFQRNDTNSSSNLRKRKKYRVVPSPLLSICFWRVCVDEAQRVEVTTTKAAKMALKLKAENFWAVSGTPIGSGKLTAPFDNREWFDSILSRSAIKGVDCRIQFILQSIFWRSTKSIEVVKRQIGIPDMREERIVLKFSSIERHFYSLQLERTMQLATNFKNPVATGERKRKAAGLDNLSECLHRLRAACCHPQVGVNGIGPSGRKLKKLRRRPSRSENESGNSISNVMTMEQILDRLIDDARRKSEEAQRLAILHTNGMAGICKLKVEAKDLGIEVAETDRSLLVTSGDLYRESLLLAQRNGIPVIANAKAILTGSTGFCFPNKSFQDGKCLLMWKIQQDFDAKIWSEIEYKASSRKLVKLRIRPIYQLPDDIKEENSNEFKWKLHQPASLVLQVATTSTEFVDCAEVSFDDNDWVDIDNIRRTNKSKLWRIVVKTSAQSSSSSLMMPCGYFVGLEIELYEPQINSDDLQSLHALHNACTSYEAAMKFHSGGLVNESNNEIKSRIMTMKTDIIAIESLHKVQAQTLHNACMIKLGELTRIRNEKEKGLFDKTHLTKSHKEVDDCWDDGWFDDFLGIVSLYGSEAQKSVIYDRIIQDVESIYDADDTMKFPDFNSLTGLKSGLSMRLRKIRNEGLGIKHNQLSVINADEFVQVRSTRFKCGKGAHRRCMSHLLQCSANPCVLEIRENSHCRLCKADWNQKGDVCRHCQIAEILKDLKPDSTTIIVLTAIFSSIRSPTGTALLKSTQTSHIAHRAKCFFDVLDAEEREKVGAWKMFNTHLNLLNGIDELSSCKSQQRLAFLNEDLTSYTEEQRNAIIPPIALSSNYFEHKTKQGTCLGDLRRSLGTLRFLQNQRRSVNGGEEEDKCVVCLRHFDEECCVLKCGHRFHQKPCFDQILNISSGINVQCPMKCRILTAKNEVLISTNKCVNDGSRVIRKIKGSYGTKISRIISDILFIRDKGEKGVVFSQWNDMLDIIESALIENNVELARPEGCKSFSSSLCSFQSPNCVVLLLNLKQGAEGLTLVHATHVFMVEPIMNNGLDQQAINRIHRIGQTKHTVVHRYLIKDTIEMKLEKIRLLNEGRNDALEDSTNSMRNSLFALGGIDGGISSQKELLEILD